MWLDVAAALLGRIEGAFHPDFISTVHESTLHIRETTKHTKDTKKKEMNLRLMILSCFRVFRVFRGSFLLLPTAGGPFNTERVASRRILSGKAKNRDSQCCRGRRHRSGR